MRKFNHVILDRDGVLNEEGPGGFVRIPEQWIWLPGVLDALAVLSQANICLSVATNQSCVGRSIIDMAALDRIHEKMKQEAAQHGVRFNEIYCCPHQPDFGCRCRKPQPGLLEEAIFETGIAPVETVFIGDAVTDLQCARAAGVTAWLVRTGKGKETEMVLKQGKVRYVNPGDVRIFDNLNRAGEAILSNKHVY